MNLKCHGCVRPLHIMFNKWELSPRPGHDFYDIDLRGSTPSTSLHGVVFSDVAAADLLRVLQLAIAGAVAPRPHQICGALELHKHV